jgi:hypothetical protein
MAVFLYKLLPERLGRMGSDNRLPAGSSSLRDYRPIPVPYREGLRTADFIRLGNPSIIGYPKGRAEQARSKGPGSTAL